MHIYCCFVYSTVLFASINRICKRLCVGMRDCLCVCVWVWLFSWQSYQTPTQQNVKFWQFQLVKWRRNCYSTLPPSSSLLARWLNLCAQCGALQGIRTNTPPQRTRSTCMTYIGLGGGLSALLRRLSVRL